MRFGLLQAALEGSGAAGDKQGAWEWAVGSGAALDAGVHDIANFAQVLVDFFFGTQCQLVGKTQLREGHVVLLAQLEHLCGAGVWEGDINLGVGALGKVFLLDDETAAD